MSEKQEKTWEFQISQYLDGLLTEAESTELQAQLKSNPELQEIFEQYQALEGNLESLADDLPEIDFDLQRREIMDRIASRAQASPVKLTRRILRPIFAVTAAAAVVLIAFALYTISRTFMPSPIPQRVQSVALRPSPVQTGEVLASVSPAAAELTTSGMVQVLAKRMDIKPKERDEKTTAGTVVVSIGSPELVAEDKESEDSEIYDTEEYWF